MSGDLTFEHDALDDVIRVRGTGLWTADQARRHFVALKSAIEGLHASGRTAYALVDLSLATVQVADVAKEVSDGTRQVYRDGDRVALVAGTALVGMQMRGASKVRHFRICESVEQGLEWLRAERAANGAG